MSDATDKPKDNGQGSKRSGLGAQTVSRSLGKVVRHAFGRQGFAEPGVLLRWPEIVGDTLARFSLPERLTFPQGERSRGTLHLRVDGQFALELQHLEPLIVERINGFFGYGAVARIAILQAPIPERALPEKRKRPKPAPQDDPALEGDDLDSALRRLAAHIVE
jgi:hypothetical protein